MMDITTKTYPTAVTVEVASHAATTGSKLVIGGINGQPSTIVTAASGSFPLTRHMAYREAAARTLIVQSEKEKVEITIPALPAVVTGQKLGSALHLYIPLNRATADLEAYFTALDTLGVTVVRASFPWLLLRPTSGSFDATHVAKVHDYLTRAAAHGMKVISPITGNAPMYACTTQVGTYEGIAYGRPTQAAVATYVAQMWAEFGGSTLTHVAVENEPNHLTGDYQTPAEHARSTNILKAGVVAAGSTWKVVLGELAFADHVYLEAMYAAGLTGADYDVLGLHPYNLNFDVTPNRWGDPRVPWPVNDNWTQHRMYGVNGLTSIMDVLTAHGDQAKHIWITEFGFSSSYDPTPGFRLSEERAAEWAMLEIDRYRRWPTVKVIAPYTLEKDDSVSQTSWVYNFGAHRNDGTRRPLYNSILGMAPMTSDPPTGGTITESGGYRIHTFTASGTFDPMGNDLTCDVLCVGGGGGGSGANATGGGGGGGGGAVVQQLGVAISASQAVTVGAGGAGNASALSTAPSGGASSVGVLVSAAGGGGGGRGTAASGGPGSNGGCGGGGGAGTTAGTGLGGTGNPGGNGGNGRLTGTSTNRCGGGGGGAAPQAGVSPVSDAGGAGGAGKASSLSGASVTYGGGGGGGARSGTAGAAGSGGGGAGSRSANGGNGGTNLGGGGGGTRDTFTGGSGGSGVVIIRYPVLT